MPTLNAIPPPIARVATPGVAAPPDLPAGQERAAASARAAFHGIRWTYRSRAVALLEEISPLAWANPQGQGWQRVKHNANREVWYAPWRGTTYYVKYYFRDTLRSRVQELFRPPVCRAEWDGGRYALQAGIAAVAPVAYTLDLHRDDRRCAVLVTEAVEPALPLDKFWLRLQSDDDPVRRRQDTARLIDLLAEMIARAHQAGFEHLDMHAANILVQTLAPRCYRTVFVDLHSARRGVPLDERAVVRNLVQLHQWFRRHSALTARVRFLRAYLRWRNEYEQTFGTARPLRLAFRDLFDALVAASERHAQHLWMQRDRRLARSGRYFAQLRLRRGWRGTAVLSFKHASDESRASHLTFDARWWCTQLETPERLLAPAPAGVCKDSHSAAVTRALLERDGAAVPVIIKRPLARNGWRALVQLWPPSRSRRAWRIGHTLLHRDVPAARPLAVLERRAGPLVLDSLLITEAIPGALDLETFLRTEYQRAAPLQWVRLKRHLAHLLEIHVRQLLERGFIHRDCKASNILVVRWPVWKLLWIDLDGIRRTRRRSPGASRRALVRLYVSLESVPGLTRTDHLRFLKSYCARYGSPPDIWRKLWPALAQAIAAKRRAKADRQRWKREHYGRA